MCEITENIFPALARYHALLAHFTGHKQTCNLKFKQSSRLGVIGGCYRRRLQAKLFCFSTFKHTHKYTHTQPPTHAGIAINWQDESGAGVGCQFSKSVRCPSSTAHCLLSGGNSILAAHTQHTHTHMMYYVRQNQ